MKISIVLERDKDIEHQNDVFLFGILKWVERSLKFVFCVSRHFNALFLAHPTPSLGPSVFHAYILGSSS